MHHNNYGVTLASLVNPCATEHTKQTGQLKTMSTSPLLLRLHGAGSELTEALPLNQPGCLLCRLVLGSGIRMDLGRH